MMRVGLEVIRKHCDLGMMFTLRTGTLLCCTHSSSKNEYESIETHQSLLKSYTGEIHGNSLLMMRLGELKDSIDLLPCR